MVVDPKVLAEVNEAVQQFKESLVRLAEVLDEETGAQMKELDNSVVNRFVEFLDNQKSLMYSGFESLVSNVAIEMNYLVAKKENGEA
jgi:hypothetical protein